MTSDGHIVKSYTAEMDRLTAMIAEMGGYAETALAEAMLALRRRDGDRAERVILGDRKIDALEEQVSALVIRLLALRQPMAADLRTIVAALKISGDLERIGDYAKNIAKRTLILNQSPPTGPVAGIAHLSRMVEAMLHEVLNAYVAGDATAAERLRERDSGVDDAHTGLFRELLTYMMEDPRTISVCTHLIFIAKNLERIGDHSTNIAENLVYQVRGERLGDRHADDPESDNPEARL
ncbi:MAG: phosphate signaling complex protein PhoU [Alphaproteobacteria bacterium]|nr:phosphate signaling complex protein PhoU [Alphaproteobacteria bacterium]MCB9928742.1 phosphate signaling complex protein PhoU [Alphaproteobacteria bacterium]